jgi:tripartite-type tricarboxylate transporter receptor subunit TctC
MRSALAPDIPTFGEMGLPRVSISPWYGLFALRGTPSEIVAQLNAAVVDALADPEVRARLTELKLEVLARQQQTPESLSRLVKASAEKWLPIIKEFGIKAQ